MSLYKTPRVQYNALIGVLLMEICKVCNKQFEKLDSLRKHTGRKHQIKSEDFYVEYVLNGNRPTCNCGCGEHTKYYGDTLGFSRYSPGHQARIENGMSGKQHTAASREKMSKTTSECYANGSLVAWNKGLTAETDQRVADYGKKSSATINANDTLIKQRSQAMKENRLSGIIPTQRGLNHSQWQGGTSPIYALVNAQTRFWTKWKTLIKQRDNNRCTRCGASASLEVHHDGERMADIVRKITTKHNPELAEMSWEMKMTVVDDVIDYHVTQNVSGVTLCKTCHVAVHEELGETYNVK